ncbi:MAG: YbaY family lipoprotein [Woeseia sp.]
MQQTSITGSLTYRERIALPPGSIARVTLSDISRADAAAPVIVETSVELGNRQVPVPFELTVPGDDLEPGSRYAVRGEIRDADGRLIWTTDTANSIDADEMSIDLGTLLLVRAPSDTGNVAPGSADESLFTARGNEPGWLLTIDAQNMTLKWNYGDDETVVPVPEPSPSGASGDGRSYVSVTEAQDLRVDVVDRICRDSMTGMPHPNGVTVSIDGQTLQGCGGSPASLLQDGEWVVEDIAGKGIIDSSRATLNFGADGSLAGRASCNSYGATWTLSGEGLAVGQARGTLMACAPALDGQEREFLRLLGAASHFDITDDGALVIRTADGETITARRE